MSIMQSTTEEQPEMLLSQFSPQIPPRDELTPTQQEAVIRVCEAMLRIEAAHPMIPPTEPDGELKL